MSATDYNAQSLISTGTGVAARLTRVGPMAIRQSYTATGQPEYIGFAKVSTGSDTPHWQIQKIIYDSNDRNMAVLWGSGNANYDKRWINRTVFVYS